MLNLFGSEEMGARHNTLDVIETRGFDMKNFYVFCFMMWGFFGLVGACGAGLYLPILSAIYAAVMWLAGCVLFGFAVLMMEAAKGVPYESPEIQYEGY
jgi:hypothetical protein